MDRVWQINVHEEELLFLTTLLAGFHQYMEENVAEFARGLSTAEAFALRMGNDRYNGLWRQMSELVKTSPKYIEYAEKMQEYGL